MLAFMTGMLAGGHSMSKVHEMSCRDIVYKHGGT